MILKTWSSEWDLTYNEIERVLGKKYIDASTTR